MKQRQKHDNTGNRLFALQIFRFNIWVTNYLTWSYKNVPVSIHWAEWHIIRGCN